MSEGGKLLVDWARETFGRVPDGRDPALRARLAEERWQLTCIPAGAFTPMPLDKSLLPRLKIDVEASSLFEPARRDWRSGEVLTPGRRCDAVRIVDAGSDRPSANPRPPIEEKITRAIFDIAEAILLQWPGGHPTIGGARLGKVNDRLAAMGRKQRAESTIRDVMRLSQDGLRTLVASGWADFGEGEMQIIDGPSTERRKSTGRELRDDGAVPLDDTDTRKPEHSSL